MGGAMKTIKKQSKRIVAFVFVLFVLLQLLPFNQVHAAAKWVFVHFSPVQGYSYSGKTSYSIYEDKKYVTLKEHAIGGYKTPKLNLPANKEVTGYNTIPNIGFISQQSLATFKISPSQLQGNSVNLIPVIKTKQLTISFFDGARIMKQVQVEYGKSVSAIVEPKKQGYLFKGWYSDRGLSNNFSFGAKVQKDLNIYGKFIKDTILFEGQKETKKVSLNETFSLKSGDVFSGSNGWNWDNAIIEANFDNAANFKALKVGKTQIFYENQEGQKAKIDIIVEEKKQETKENAAAPTSTETDNELMAKNESDELENGIRFIWLIMAGMLITVGFIVVIKKRKEKKEEQKVTIYHPKVRSTPIAPQDIIMLKEAQRKIALNGATAKIQAKEEAEKKDNFIHVTKSPSPLTVVSEVEKDSNEIGEAATPLNSMQAKQFTQVSRSVIAIKPLATKEKTIVQQTLEKPDENKVKEIESKVNKTATLELDEKNEVSQENSLEQVVKNETYERNNKDQIEFQTNSPNLVDVKQGEKDSGNLQKQENLQLSQLEDKTNESPLAKEITLDQNSVSKKILRSEISKIIIQRKQERNPLPKEELQLEKESNVVLEQEVQNQNKANVAQEILKQTQDLLVQNKEKTQKRAQLQQAKKEQAKELVVSQLQDNTLEEASLEETNEIRQDTLDSFGLTNSIKQLIQKKNNDLPADIIQDTQEVIDFQLVDQLSNQVQDTMEPVAQVNNVSEQTHVEQVRQISEKESLVEPTEEYVEFEKQVTEFSNAEQDPKPEVIHRVRIPKRTLAVTIPRVEKPTRKQNKRRK